MQTVREAWVKQSHENLFRDTYGILKLAADATLTKTSGSSKLTGYLPLKCEQWRKSVLAAIKQLFRSNTITFSDFTWLESEIITYKIIDQSHVKTTKKSGILFNRGGKKINYRRKSNRCIAKKMGIGYQSLSEHLRSELFIEE